MNRHRLAAGIRNLANHIEPKGDPPRCKCHDEPMQTDGPITGKWRCAVNRRERRAKERELKRDEILDYKRRWYAENRAQKVVKREAGRAVLPGDTTSATVTPEEAAT